MRLQVDGISTQSRVALLCLSSSTTPFDFECGSTQRQLSTAMAHGIGPPLYNLEPIRLPHPSLFTIQDLDEGAAVLASTVFPAQVSNRPHPRALSQKIAKLLQLRYGDINFNQFDLISGTIPSSETWEREKEIRKWTANVQSEWIGVPSWAQQW